MLLLGESGSGKELAAREIRRASARASAPWVPVNCAALSETLLLSDLFGHARGAFTGADRARAGVFETANGGTVFLDEIGDLPPVAQGNLLRVLQEGEVRRLGEVDGAPRGRAPGGRDPSRPRAMVRDGRFRQDLYYRLKVCTVTLPPLRERGEDLMLLAEHFLAAERRRRPVPQLHLAADARRRIEAHRWPGNVRELANALQAAAALAGNGADPRVDAGPRRAGARGVGDRGERLSPGVDDFRRALLRRRCAPPAATGPRPRAAWACRARRSPTSCSTSDSMPKPQESKATDASGREAGARLMSQARRERPDEPLEPLAVALVEIRRQARVEVEHRRELAAFVEDRHDDLRAARSSQAMWPGKAWTSGTSWVARSRAAAPQTPRENGISRQPRGP